MKATPGRRTQKTPAEEETDTAALITRLTEYITKHGLPARYGDVIGYLQYLITEEKKSQTQ